MPSIRTGQNKMPFRLPGIGKLKKTTLQRWFFSYLIILLVPMLLSVGIYFFTYKLVSELCRYQVISPLLDDILVVLIRPESAAGKQQSE
jgi:hypothetical protein